MLPNHRPLSEPWRFEAFRKVPLLAASLAFQTILGIVPVLGLSLWYLRRVGYISTWADKFKAYILAQLNVGANNTVVAKVEAFVGGVQTNSWGWIGLVVLIYTGFSLIFSLGRCFDIILETRGGAEKSTGFWAHIALLRRTIALPLLPLVLAGSIAAVGWIRKDSPYRWLLRQQSVGPWMAKPLPWLIDFLGFATIYYLIPREKVALKYAVRAALWMTPIYEIGKSLMQIYARNSFATAKLYGALAVIPIFMIWIQWAWIILLSGVITFPGPKKKLAP